jgi:CBS domain-containing protein
MLVGTVVTRDIPTAHPELDVRSAARLLLRCRCGVLPVVANDDGGPRVVGVLRYREAFAATYDGDEGHGSMPVATAMAPANATCRATDSLGVGLRQLRRSRPSRGPVTLARSSPGRLDRGGGVGVGHHVRRAEPPAALVGPNPSVASSLRGAYACLMRRDDDLHAALVVEEPILSRELERSMIRAHPTRVRDRVVDQGLPPPGVVRKLNERVGIRGPLASTGPKLCPREQATHRLHGVFQRPEGVAHLLQVQPIFARLQLV